jgi:uncharacterized protein with FMN-binding domain
MKKYIIAGVLVIAFVVYLVFANKNSSNIAIAPSGTPPTTGPTPTTPATTTPAGGTPTPTSTKTGSTGQYKDGTYTGSVADAFYGNLQAAVTINGGMITDVTFPQYPTGEESGHVSRFALPALKQEAIAAQNANVNIVSGATQDSEAFRQSLASALAQAKS